MWTRKELKMRGNAAMKANYWKTMFIALILALVIGGTGSVSSGSASGVSSGISSMTSAFSSQVGGVTRYASGITAAEGASIRENMDSYAGEMETSGDTGRIMTMSGTEGIAAAAVIMIVIIVFILIMILTVIFITLDILIFNPLEIGCRRFSLINLNQKANVSEIGFGFDNEYKNVVKVMFYRDLFTVLWSLLFIIPGIIKSYEYRMIPFLLADHPNMSKDEAFAISRSMMTGQKWNAFVLDLSFLGWELLSLFTGGLLSAFYVSPYRMMTNAALYEVLAYGTPETTYPAGPETGYENSGQMGTPSGF